MKQQGDSGKPKRNPIPGIMIFGFGVVMVLNMVDPEDLNPPGTVKFKSSWHKQGDKSRGST